MRGRMKQCEAVGLNTAALIRRHHWTELKSILRLTVQRDGELDSIGVRTAAGRLRFATDGHKEYWQGQKAAGAGGNMQLPVHVNRRHWGQIEFSFDEPQQGMLEALLHDPFARLTGFLTLAGLGIYALIFRPMIGGIGTAQVVPDRVQQALDTLAEGLLVLDEGGRVILANRAFAERTGLEKQQIHGTLASELDWAPADDGTPLEYPWLQSGEDEAEEGEKLLHYRLSDGSLRVFSTNNAPILAGDGSRRGTLATFRDVTHVEEHRAELEEMLSVLRCSRDEVKKKNRELEILATQDALTGCLNRRAFFEFFDQHWETCTRAGKPLACMMIDNDHFKQVNDTYGHQTGDHVLRMVSELLRDAFTGSGVVCRYGGEEFCVLLPEHDAAMAERLAERVRQQIEQVRLDSHQDLQITASIGVSDLSHDAEDPQDLINQADMCLYVAKRQGRNRVVLFEPQLAVISAEEASTTSPAEAASVDSAGFAPEGSHSIPFPAVSALVSALAYRDADTADHSRRVADLCVTTAAGLLDAKQTHLLEIAALLHDIGKIGIPDDILLKPGRLTQREWSVMTQQQHIGLEIIATTFHCQTLTEITRTHNAFFGGQEGQSHLPTGDAIPLAARILAICDCYDSITSDRPFRKGRRHAEAVAELRRCVGTQFDPALVERFIEKIEALREIEQERGEPVGQRLSLEIGQQIERIAEATDERDEASVNAIASRLAKVAEREGHAALAVTAASLADQVSVAEQDWGDIVEIIDELFRLCHQARGEGRGARSEERGARS